MTKALLSSEKIDDCPIEAMKKQRSHNLYVFSNPASQSEQNDAYLDWFMGSFFDKLEMHNIVLSAQHYERQDFDITTGFSRPCNYRYLGIYELSLDGAQEAQGLIECIEDMHQTEQSAGESTCWLYYPISEKVGRTPKTPQQFLGIAFANGLPGHEDQFREWYSTQHIRHALNVPGIVSAQLFERAEFQTPGVTKPNHRIHAIYEQEGTVETLSEGLPLTVEMIPPSANPNVTFDIESESGFSEWFYYPINREPYC